MTVSFPRLIFCALLAVSGAAPVARAGFVNLGPAGDFNVFVFGDNSQSSTDSEGRVAVGGNANFGSGYNVASHLAGSTTDNLIVGGNLTNVYNQLQGGLLVNGNVNWQTPTFFGRVNVNGTANFGTGGGSAVGPINVVGSGYIAPNWFPPNAASPTVTPLPFSFSAVQNYLTAESALLASLPATGTTTNYYGQLLLNSASPPGNLAIFSVNGLELSSANQLSITAPAGSTVVVNVNGTSDSFKYMSVDLHGVDNQHVLYNFSQATSLYLDGIGVQGTILAPLADVNFNYGQFNGTMIAKNLTGHGEAHSDPFLGTLPPLVPVPEPSSLVLLGTGILVMWVMLRWNQCRA